MRRDRPRILLLNPPPYRGYDVVRLWRSEYVFLHRHAVPPMDLAYFCAAAKGEAALLLLDANAEQLDGPATLERMRAFRPDLVLVKGVINILEHDLEPARRLKQLHPEVRLILSCRGALGLEQQLLAELPFVDAVARGEIDAFAHELCAGTPLEQIDGLALPGRPCDTIRVVSDLDVTPLPDLEALPPLWVRRYRAPHWGCHSGYFLTTARGCPYGCTFCLCALRPFSYRRRDPANVVEELRWIQRRYDLRDMLVFDEIFTMPRHTEAVCQAMLDAGLRLDFVCEGKPDLVQRPMLQLMRRAGCFCIHYGVESGDETILQHSRKGHTTEQCRHARELTRQAGILCSVYIILGFPDESLGSVLRTVRLLRAMGPDLIRFDALLPYPATAVHRELARDDLLMLTPRRQQWDRRVSPLSSAAGRHHTRYLGPRRLALLERLFRLVFHRELHRRPTPQGCTMPPLGRAPRPQ